jgi:integrase
LWFQQHKLSKMKRSTVKTMQGHISLYLLPQFASCTLRTITAEKVNEWLSSDDVGHLSSKTMKHIVTTLSLITGVKYGRRAVRYPASKQFKEEERCFTPEEMSRIIENAESPYNVLYAIATETGMRCGELYALEITDVDFTRNQIHVRRSCYDGEVDTVKTPKAYRVIDAQSWLIELIRQHIGDRKQGLVIMNERNQACRNTTVLRRHLHPLSRKLNIKQAGMHAFRHGRVSYLVEQGVSRDIIKAWIGHGSDAMIENYMHLRMSYRAAALANVKPPQPNYPTVAPSMSGDRVAAGA